MKRTFGLRSSSCALAMIPILAATAFATDRYVPSQYPTIQSAINACSPGDTVLVAPGIYTEVLTLNGAFTGAGITVKGQNPSNLPILGVAPTGQQISNSGPLVSFVNSDRSTLQHFMISGNHNVAIPSHGGAIAIINSSPTLQLNRIRTNRAIKGGGIYCSGVASAPLITQCYIWDNTADQKGGGIYVGQGARPKILSNRASSAPFSVGGIGTGVPGEGGGPGNGAGGGGGGGIAVEDDSIPEIVNNAIGLNTVGSSLVSGNGAGIWCYNNATPFPIMNNILENNIASGNGGGIFAKNSRQIIEQNDFTYNVAMGVGGSASDGFGGGVHLESNSGPSVENNTFVQNIARYYGGAISLLNSDPNLRVKENQISENVAGLRGAGMYMKTTAESPTSYQAISFNSIESNGMARMIPDIFNGGNINIPAVPFGGGVAIEADGGSMPQPLLLTNAIKSNAALIDGGGIYVSSPLNGFGQPMVAFPSPRIQGNQVNDNAGGGISLFASGVDVRDNLILGNHRPQAGFGYGAGIVASYARFGPVESNENNIIISNNIIAQNVSENGQGGGINLHLSDPLNAPFLLNNTVTDNDVSDHGSGFPGTPRGSGIFVGGSWSSFVAPRIWNSIVVNNLGNPNAAQIQTEEVYPPIDVFFSSISTSLGQGSSWLAKAGTVVGYDPFFVNPAERNYHLAYVPFSTCIDRGSDTVLDLPQGMLCSMDIDGEARPYGLATDIGADEVYPLVLTPRPRTGGLHHQ